MKAHEFFRAKNLDTDLIILNEDKSIYEQYVKEAIEQAILNSQIGYLKNKSIFVLNSLEIPEDDKKLISFKSSLIFDAHNGNIQTQLNDLEEEYLNSIKNIGDEPSRERSY